MRRRSPAVIAAILLLTSLAAVVPPVSAADDAQARHEQVVAHWTPERMMAAVPRDFVRDAAGNFVPKAKPGGGGGGAVTGASWTKDGLILKASGKVYFEMGGSGWICSGSVVGDSRTEYSLVLTAGHCAYDETTGEAATYWLFIPEFDSAPTYTCASTKYGCWTAVALAGDSRFATAGSFNTQATTHDFAFAIVGPGGKGGGVPAQLDAAVGSFGIAYSGVNSGNKLYAFGYPAAGKYRGSDLTYCAGNIFTDAWNANLTWGMGCNMTGGSSGGPWLSSFSESTGVGTLSSLNSYGYSGVKNMYGPKFNGDTQAVYNAADGATGDTLVP